MAKDVMTTESYINHHLTNLTCGKTPDGWTCDPYKVDQMSFWAFHVDSLFWSIFLGALFIIFFKSSIFSSTPSLFLVLVNLDTIKISLTANLIFLYIFISYPNFIGLIIIKL